MCAVDALPQKKTIMYGSVRQILTTNHLLHNGLLRGCRNVSCSTLPEILKHLFLVKVIIVILVLSV